MIFLGIGTNIGDRGENLENALHSLEQKGVDVGRCSSIYETPPWGITDQAAFYNMVAEVNYSDTPVSLLQHCLTTEEEMGRERIIKWGPRLIDIDILEFHREIHLTPTLHLPHPFYTQREFVLVPLAELEPNWKPTLSLRSIREIIEGLNVEKVNKVGEMRREKGGWEIGLR